MTDIAEVLQKIRRVAVAEAVKIVVEALDDAGDKVQANGGKEDLVITYQLMSMSIRNKFTEWALCEEKQSRRDTKEPTPS